MGEHHCVSHAEADQEKNGEEMRRIVPVESAGCDIADSETANGEKNGGGNQSPQQGLKSVRRFE